MKNNFYLKDLEQNIKYFLVAFLITITAGICTGLSYIYYTTNIAADSISERYAGSTVEDEYEIPENFPKSIENMIQTTHEHVNSFAIISFMIGIIFYFNSIISGTLKTFLMIEPFISTIITFLSLWLIRFLNTNFAYLVIVSSTIMYFCWFVMIGTMIYELLSKKD